MDTLSACSHVSQIQYQTPLNQHLWDNWENINDVYKKLINNLLRKSSLSLEIYMYSYVMALLIINLKNQDI